MSSVGRSSQSVGKKLGEYSPSSFSRRTRFRQIDSVHARLIPAAALTAVGFFPDFVLVLTYVQMVDAAAIFPPSTLNVPRLIGGV